MRISLFARWQVTALQQIITGVRDTTHMTESAGVYEDDRYANADEWVDPLRIWPCVKDARPEAMRLLLLLMLLLLLLVLLQQLIGSFQ